MRPSPTYHPSKGEECETLVEHGLPLWAEPAVGYCSRRPRPSPKWGSCFVEARAVGPLLGEQKPLDKTPLGGNPSSEMTLPPYPPPFSLSLCFFWYRLEALRPHAEPREAARCLKPTESSRAPS